MTKIKKETKEVLFQPKYSIKLQDFITDKIEGGMTLAEVCREYSTIVPIEKSLYRWKKKYPDFKKAVDEAYQTLIFKMMDEMNDLSKEIRDLDSKWGELEVELSEQAESVDGLSLKEADAKMRMLSYKIKDKRDSAKVRLKALEFMLTRIAPKLVPELKDSVNEHTIVIPTVNIVSYRTIEGELVREQLENKQSS